MCNECNEEIARRAKEGLPYDEEEVAKVVQERRYLKNQRENEERLEELIDASGRDNWRDHRDRADNLQQIVNDMKTLLRTAKCILCPGNGVITSASFVESPDQDCDGMSVTTKDCPWCKKRKELLES
jgi:hypothetical protein